MFTLYSWANSSSFVWTTLSQHLGFLRIGTTSAIWGVKLDNTNCLRLTHLAWKLLHLPDGPWNPTVFFSWWRGRMSFKLVDNLQFLPQLKHFQRIFCGPFLLRQSGTCCNIVTCNVFVIKIASELYVVVLPGFISQFSPCNRVSWLRFLQALPKSQNKHCKGPTILMWTDFKQIKVGPCWGCTSCIDVGKA